MARVRSRLNPIGHQSHLSFRNTVHERRRGLLLSSALVASLLPLPTLSSQLLAHIVFRSLYLPALSLSRTSASPTFSHEAMKRSSLVIATPITDFLAQATLTNSWLPGLVATRLRPSARPPPSA